MHEQTATPASECPHPFVFFLGGNDLEMEAIRELLKVAIPSDRVHDRKLQWGARASSYLNEIKHVANEGLVPVLVELKVDTDLPDSAVIIDHHNERAGAEMPTALEQVFALLDLPNDRWTRWLTLVAANDRGYIPAMKECGATESEMREIRAADRNAQGVNAEEERQAKYAIDHAKDVAGGRLTIVSLPHNHTSPVADRLHPALGGRGYRNLLVCCTDSVTFYGDGALIRRLTAAFPGGWWGGALPGYGYWGGNYDPRLVRGVLEAALAQLDGSP